MRRRVDGLIPSYTTAMNELWRPGDNDDDLTHQRRGKISMAGSRFCRLFRRYRRALIKGTLIGLVLILVWDIMWLTRAPYPARASLSEPLPKNERYFIASIHWNNEAILRSHWVKAVVDLVEHLGPENTYTSVLEGGSWDDSKGALRILEQSLSKLHAPHHIVLDPTTHIDEITRVPGAFEPGWIWTPRNQKELRRIPYLSRLRNAVLDDLLRHSNASTPFTKILWLNDVIFTTADIRTLLATRGGAYAAACSLDFAHPPRYYDTFALRDANGNKAVSQTWPYFRSGRTRNALVRNQPAPVQSCWNGVVAMAAAPFYDRAPELRFRGIEDSLAVHHLEASECCLIHADNPLAEAAGVWLNPNVRVGYNPAAYDVVKVSSRENWPDLLTRVWGLWGNRFLRLMSWPRMVVERQVVNRRVRSWRKETPDGAPERVEKGTDCIVNEMQVLIANGWKHL